MQLTRSNRRKTTKCRRTQVIDVPLVLIKKDLSEQQKLSAKIVLKQTPASFIADNINAYSKLFEPNKSEWAGKRKFIFHTPQAY